MAGSHDVLDFNDVNFDSEVLKSDVPVLVDFTGEHCGPCKILSPIVEKLAADYRGKVKVGKLFVENSPATAARYGIRGIPRVIVFKQGKKVAESGMTTRDRLIEMLGV